MAGKLGRVDEREAVAGLGTKGSLLRVCVCAILVWCACSLLTKEIHLERIGRVDILRRKKCRSK